MNRFKLYKTDLICSECGSILPTQTKERKKTETIKNKWCYVCRKKTKFITVGDMDFIKKELEFSKKEDLNETQERISALLFKEKESTISKK